MSSHMILACSHKIALKIGLDTAFIIILDHQSSYNNVGCLAYSSSQSSNNVGSHKLSLVYAFSNHKLTRVGLVSQHITYLYDHVGSHQFL